MRKLAFAVVAAAPSLAWADDVAPLVVARLPTNASGAQVAEAVCGLRLPGVDVSLDDRRCAFGLVPPGAVPLSLQHRDGLLVFEGRVDPEIVRNARTIVEGRLALGNDYLAGTYVVSTWRPRNPTLRDAGLVTTVFGGAAILVAPWLALAAQLEAHPLFCFNLFSDKPCGGDPGPLIAATVVDALAGIAVLSLGVAAFRIGRTKVVVLTGATTTLRVAF